MFIAKRKKISVGAGKLVTLRRAPGEFFQAVADFFPLGHMAF